MTKRRNQRESGRALLLEAGARRGVALTPDGRFVAVVCRPEDEEGREVCLGLPGRRSAVRDPDALGRAFRRRAPAWGLRPALAAAVVLVLLLGVASPFAVGRILASGSPVAFVTLDINPSLEFGVNRWSRVVTAATLNEDGEAVLSGLDWRGRPLADIVLEAGLAAAGLGFLGAAGDGLVILAAVPAADGAPVSPALARQLDRVREDLSRRLARTAPGVTVETIVGDAASLRSEARELGLSVGRYSVLLAAQERGLDILPADIGLGIARAIAGAGGEPSQVLKDAHLTSVLSKLAEKFQERNGLGPGGAPGGSFGPGGPGLGRGPDDEDDDDEDDGRGQGSRSQVPPGVPPGVGPPKLPTPPGPPWGGQGGGSGGRSGGAGEGDDAGDAVTSPTDEPAGDPSGSGHGPGVDPDGRDGDGGDSDAGGDGEEDEEGDDNGG